MDLCKTFDCLTNDVLLLKLKCYGLSDDALELVKDYLSERQQRNEICESKSDFLNIV